MIDKNTIKTIVNDQLNPDKEFLVEINVSSSNKILVLIDGEEGITIERCVAISKAIEQSLDREEEDFELEVSSAGLSSPLKVLRQYKKNLGQSVEVVLQNGEKTQGKLIDANEEGFTIEIEEMVKLEGKKRKQLVTRQQAYNYNDIKSTTIVILFR